MIIDYLKKFKEASKTNITELLFDKPPQTLTEKQKKSKISNLIYSLSKKEKIIVNQGSHKKPKWVLRSVDL